MCQEQFLYPRRIAAVLIGDLLCVSCLSECFFLRERDIGKLVFGLQLFDLWNLRIDFFLPFLQAPFVAQANLFVIMQDICFFQQLKIH